MGREETAPSGDTGCAFFTGNQQQQQQQQQQQRQQLAADLRVA